MADKGCVACAHGQPCQGCASKSSGSVAPSVPVTSPQGGSPSAMRRRTVTGAHPAPVFVGRSSGGAVASPSSPVAHDHDHAHEQGRMSGDPRSDDPERDAFLQGIRSLPQDQQSARLEQWMRQRGESETATRTAVASLLQGGIATVQQFLRDDASARMERIRTGAATDMERLRQQGLTDRAEIYARYGYIPGQDPANRAVLPVRSRPRLRCTCLRPRLRCTRPVAAASWPIPTHRRRTRPTRRCTRRCFLSRRSVASARRSTSAARRGLRCLPFPRT